MDFPVRIIRVGNGESHRKAFKFKSSDQSGENFAEGPSLSPWLFTVVVYFVFCYSTRHMGSAVNTVRYILFRLLIAHCSPNRANIFFIKSHLVTKMYVFIYQNEGNVKH